MTEEKFKQIKELQNKIEAYKRKVKIIDALLVSCSLSCKITGTQKMSIMETEYLSINKEEIKRLLLSDREKISNELLGMEKLFSEQ